MREIRTLVLKATSSMNGINVASENLMEDVSFLKGSQVVLGGLHSRPKPMLLLHLRVKTTPPSLSLCFMVQIASRDLIQLRMMLVSFFFLMILVRSELTKNPIYAVACCVLAMLDARWIDTVQ
jgi:hypothetical protein